MFRRKLRALDFLQAGEFDYKNEMHIRNCVLWLEDQKIRHYKIEEREGLRMIENPQKWKEAYRKYLGDVGCPYDVSDESAVLDWLLGLAVRYDYGDQVDLFKEKTADKIISSRSVSNPQFVSENPLDKLNFEEEDFKNGVGTVAKLLNIPAHPDHLVVLKAVSKLIQARLSVEAVQEKPPDTKDSTPISLENLELGFDTGDYVLNNAAKALRLLHVCELRDLQTRINETIVAVQNLTANPRTDDKLGQVGYG